MPFWYSSVMNDARSFDAASGSPLSAATNQVAPGRPRYVHGLVPAVGTRIWPDAILSTNAGTSALDPPAHQMPSMNIPTAPAAYRVRASTTLKLLVPGSMNFESYSSLKNSITVT